MLYLIAAIAVLLIVSGYAFWKKNQKETQLQNAYQSFQTILSASTDAIMVLKEDNTILYMNDAMTHMLHLKGDEKILSDLAMPMFELQGEPKDLLDLIRDAEKARGDDPLFFTPQITIETRRHAQLTVDLYLGFLPDTSSKDKQRIVIIRDLREAFREIASSERDPLTHLPNRSRAFKDFQMRCAKHHIKEEKFALMAIGLDHFLITRSWLGHEKTDSTILAVTHTLVQLSLLHHYKIYQLSYAHFLLILPEITSVDEAFSLAETLQSNLAKLYQDHRSPVYLTASIGIASFPESGQPVSLFDNVHKALIEAKNQGTGSIHLHREAFAKKQHDHSQLQHDLAFAIEREELVIFYQPIVDAHSHEVVAAEALMRWNHPKHGMVPPYIFIPLMEETGFIIEAGRFLIREVIRQQERWRSLGFKEIVVSLNASMREIDSSDYIDFLSRELKENHVDAATIKIEITENLAMSSKQKILDVLSHLHALGVPLALDNFGTGYTSFSYLTHLPADTLKIDKSFIDDILTDHKHQQVVRAIIEVGHALQMKIVAEGIEDKQTASLLEEYGCEYLQGYYFAKPMPAFEIQSHLRKKETFENNTGSDGDPVSDTLPLTTL